MVITWTTFVISDYLTENQTEPKLQNVTSHTSKVMLKVTQNFKTPSVSKC